MKDWYWSWWWWWMMMTMMMIRWGGGRWWRQWWWCRSVLMMMRIMALACVTTLHVTLLLYDESWHETNRKRCGKYLIVFWEISWLFWEIFGLFSISQKCEIMIFSKNTLVVVILFSQFLPSMSKSNIEGWQMTNRECAKC